MNKFKLSGDDKTTPTESSKSDTKATKREESSVNILWNKRRDVASAIEDDGYAQDEIIYTSVYNVIENLEIMSLEDLEKIRKNVLVVKNKWFQTRRDQEKAEVKAIKDTFKGAKKYINQRVARVTKSLSRK